MDKLALCVRREELKSIINLPHAAYFDDVNPDFLDLLATCTFRSRPECELEPEWKQIIPYVVVRVPTDQQLVLTYYRSQLAGEKRLRGLRSIGFGGHLEPADLSLEPGCPLRPALRQCALREAEEEGVPADNGLLSFRGFVNYDRTEVGRVHFGVVYELTLLSTELVIADPEILSPRFLPWATLDRTEFEDWSKRILVAKPRFLG